MRTGCGSIFGPTRHFEHLLCVSRYIRTREQRKQVSWCPQGAAWRVGRSKSAPVCPALPTKRVYLVLGEHKKEVTNSALGHRERVREAGTSGLGLQDTPFPSRSLTRSLGTISAFKGKARVGPHVRLPSFSFRDIFMGRRGRHSL